MSRRGFTLLEVLVALAVAGLVMLLAQRLFAAAARGSQVLLRQREALDRERNAIRWMDQALLSLSVGRPGDAPFEGTTTSLRFQASLETAGGWLESMPVQLRLSDDSLWAETGHGRMALARGVDSLAFDYLLELGASTTWLREWHSPVSAPYAVRLRLARAAADEGRRVDTLLFLIKGRG